jgi:hypothetical protein
VIEENEATPVTSGPTGVTYENTLISAWSVNIAPKLVRDDICSARSPRCVFPAPD